MSTKIKTKFHFDPSLDPWSEDVWTAAVEAASEAADSGQSVTYDVWASAAAPVAAGSFVGLDVVGAPETPFLPGVFGPMTLPTTTPEPLVIPGLFAPGEYVPPTTEPEPPITTDGTGSPADPAPPPQTLVIVNGAEGYFI
jgi:hypothetical protein